MDSESKLRIKKEISNYLVKLGMDISEYKETLQKRYNGRKITLADWLKELDTLKSKYEFNEWLTVKKKQYGHYANLSFE